MDNSKNVTVQERLKAFLENENISNSEFGRRIGVSNAYVTSIRKSIQPEKLRKISTEFPNLNISWLITGEGDMYQPSDETTEKSFSSNETAITSDDSVIMIPIVHIDSVGGMHSPNSIIEEEQFIEGYAPFVDARAGDICIIQSGDSMVPTCPSGSLLLLRQVPNWKEYFGYGNIFVIELTDGRRITKEVTRYDEDPRNFIWCVSHNPNVPDEELPKNMIKSVWKVIKIQINKGW